MNAKQQIAEKRRPLSLAERTASGKAVHGKFVRRDRKGTIKTVQRDKAGTDMRTEDIAYDSVRPVSRKACAPAKKEAPISKRTVQTVIEAAKNLDAGKVSAPVDFERYRRFTK